MNWFLKALRQYADFKGRARRREYWYFMLFSSLITWGLVVVDLVLAQYGIWGEWEVFSSLWRLFVLLPSVAVLVRRLHDVGWNGWAALLMLIPIVGPIILLVKLVTPSEPWENEYGPDPLSEPADALGAMIDEIGQEPSAPV